MAQLVPYEGTLDGFVPEEELETQAQPQGTQPQLVPYEGDLEGFVPEEELQAQPQSEGSWTDYIPGFSSPEELKQRFDRPLGDALREDFVEKTPHGMVAAGGWNAAKNIGQTIAAGADQLLGTNSAGAIETAIPSYEPTSTIGQVTIPAGEIGAGMLTGAGLAGQVGKVKAVADKLPSLIKAVGGYISSVGGGVAAADDKTKPLVTGDNALIPIFEGMGKDEKGNFSEDLLRNKLNLLAESLAIAKPVEYGLRGVTGSLGWVVDETIGNVTRWKDMTTKERQAVKDTATVLSGFNPNASAKEQAAWYRKVADSAERQKEATYKVNVDGVDDATVKRTTSRALIEDGVSPADQARLAGVEAEILAKGAPETEAIASTASTELERVANQTRKAFGGSEMADKSKDDIYTGIQDDIDNTYSDVAAKEFEAAHTNQNLDDVVKQDDFLGQSVSKSEAERDLSLVERHNTTADDIAKTHFDAQMDRKAPFKERYSNIDSKIKIDQKSLDDGIAQLEEFGEILPSHLKKQITASGGNYVKFKREILPQLKEVERELWAASSTGSKGAGSQARRLQTFIKNQEDFQDEFIQKRSNGNSRVLNEINRVNQDYKNEVVPYRQGTARKIEDDTKKNFGRPDDTIVQNRKTVKSTLDDPDSAEHSKRLFESLPEGKKHLKGDYVLGAWANKFADRIRDKGIDALDPTELAQFGRQYRPLLDGDNLKRYDKFISNVENRKLTAEQFKTEIDIVRSNADKARKEIEGETAPFVDKQGKVKQEGDDVFESYLSDKDGANQLDSLIKRADKTPDGRKGLKSSFVNLMKKKMFRSGTDPAGGKNVSETFVKALDDGDKLIKFGEKVFSDEPDVMAVYKGLMKEAGNATSLKGATKVSQTAINQADIQASKGIDFVITQAFGALSRWGSRIRSATGKYVTSQSSKDMVLKARDAIQSNPQLFAKYMREEADNIEKGVSPNVRKRMYDFLVLQGTLTEEDKDSFLEDNFKTQTKKVFGVD